MKGTGRPVLGAISGLLFGFFLALNLQQWGVVPLNAFMLYGLPVLGLLLGIWLGRSTPLRRSPSTPAATPPDEAAADPESAPEPEAPAP